MICYIWVELNEVGCNVRSNVAPHDLNPHDEMKYCPSHEGQDGVDVAFVIICHLVSMIDGVR